MNRNKSYTDIVQTVFNTPLVRLNRIIPGGQWTPALHRDVTTTRSSSGRSAALWQLTDTKHAPNSASQAFSSTWR